MENPIKLTEKYERNGLERIRTHALSSQADIVYI